MSPKCIINKIIISIGHDSLQAAKAMRSRLKTHGTAPDEEANSSLPFHLTKSFVEILFILKILEVGTY